MLTAEVISNSDFHSKIEDGKLWQHVVVTTWGLKSYIRSTSTWKSTRCTLKKGTLQTSIQKPRQEITENHVRMLVHCTWETMIYLHMGNHEVHACCGSREHLFPTFVPEILAPCLNALHMENHCRKYFLFYSFKFEHIE